MKKQKPNNSNDWESRFYEKWEKAPDFHDPNTHQNYPAKTLEMLADSGKIIKLSEVKSFISSQLQRERERVIEEFAKIVDKSYDKDFGTYDYKQIAEDFISEINSLRKK